MTYGPTRVHAAFSVLGFGIAATSCGVGDGASSNGTGGTQGAALGGAGGQGSSTAAAGSPSSGGSSGSTGGAGTNPTGPTGPCPVWPRERFFPLIGVFFYGTNPMPCTRTHTSPPDVSSSIDGTYDFEYDSDGYVAAMTHRDGTASYSYTRDDGVVISEVDAKETGETTVTYHYGPNSARYETSSGSNFEYRVDAQGYPLSISGSYSSSAASPDSYVYEYDGCRIKQRTAYFSTGGLDSDQTQTYEYDAEGRLIAIVSGHGTETYDYSCR